MKKAITFALIFVATAGLSVFKTPDSWIFQSTKDNLRTALEVRPTRGILPFRDAITEVVWYRSDKNQASSGCYERFNISAMNDAEAMYRFGVERGNCLGDYHRPIVFCFERPEAERGLPAKCPFMLDSDGETVHITGKLYINGQEVK